MEENKYIEELDAFAKRYVKEIPQEKLSIDFTAAIMQNILEDSRSSVFTPKALISKKGWFLITGLLIVAIFVPFKQMKETTIKFPELDFSFLDTVEIPNLFDLISVSETVLYALFFFGLMVMAQVVFLKGYFEKRI